MAKILYVEDEGSLLAVYSEILESEGHEVLKASDGETGANLALNEDWDFLFLDIMLPGLDGVSILRKLYEKGMTKDRKVVILSNLDNPKIVDECMKIGAYKHLNKAGITPEDVLDIVESPEAVA